MIRTAVILFAFAAIQFAVTPHASAQNFGYGGYGGQGGYGNHGNCWNNNCYGSQGYGVHNGGCATCATTPSVIVRVRVGGQTAAPSVQTYYPQIEQACPGCYGNSQPASSSRFASRRQNTQSNVSGSSRIPASSGSAGTSYRYKF